MTATILESDAINLDNYAKAINTGRTNHKYFYVGCNFVMISSPFYKLSEAEQKEELVWFLRGKNYTLNY